MNNYNLVNQINICFKLQEDKIKNRSKKNGISIDIEEKSRIRRYDKNLFFFKYILIIF